MIRSLFISFAMLGATSAHGHFDYKAFKQVFEKAPALVKDQLPGFSAMHTVVNDHDIDAVFCQYDSDEEIHTVTTGVRCKDQNHTGTLSCAVFNPSSTGKECPVDADDNIPFAGYVNTIVSQADDIINFQGKERVFQETFRRTERAISKVSATGITLINCRLNGAKRLLSVFTCPLPSGWNDSELSFDESACTLSSDPSSDQLCKFIP